MIQVQTFLSCSLSEGVGLAQHIAHMMEETYGCKYIHTETALWGVSVRIIDEPEPEKGFVGFHVLLEAGADASWTNDWARGRTSLSREHRW